LNVTFSFYSYLKQRERDGIDFTEDEFHLKSIVDDVVHRFCRVEPKKPASTEPNDPFGGI